MFDNKNTNGFLLWLNQIKKCLLENKYPSNDELYLSLIDYEEQWRKILINSQFGDYIYKKFVDYILYTRKNILDARTYFRLRQTDFISQVNPFIKNKEYKQLMGLRINFTFMSWALNQIPEHESKKELIDIYKKIIKIRNDFLIRNSPLLINRIKLINRAYPFLYKDMQDLISLSSNAALVALDKFVPNIDKETGKPQYTSVLLSSVMRRINAAAIKESANQKIHMYPKDRKVLTCLRKMKKNGYEDDEIAEIMGISEFEIERLLNSTEMIFFDNDESINIHKTEHPDLLFQKNELENIVNNCIDDLSIIEKKILKLKGFL